MYLTVIDDAQQNKTAEPRQRRNKHNARITPPVTEWPGETSADDEFKYAPQKRYKRKPHALQCVTVDEKHREKHRTATLYPKYDPYLRQKQFRLFSTDKKSDQLTAENQPQYNDDISNDI